MKLKYFSLFCLWCWSSALWAQDLKERADKAYQNEQYPAAIAQYESLLQSEGESFEVRYNLGNAYYKAHQLGKSILNYERALLLQPGNEDTRFNLEFVKSKTADRIVPKSEVFLITWFRNVTNLFNESQWAVTAIVTFILLLVCVGLYFFASTLILRKLGFFGAFICLMLTICANVGAYIQAKHLTHRNKAVVMAPSVTVKSTPDERGTNLFLIHEGTGVTITDDTMKGWKEIQLEDGKKGWIMASSIEKI